MTPKPHRTHLPMSALITGLLAVPALGFAPPPTAGAPSPTALVRAASFPAEMPAEVALLMRRLAGGQTPDANGMQSLQTRLALAMQQRLAKTSKKSDEA